MEFQIALSGDSIINKRISECDRDEFLHLIDLFREADVAFTHLETLIHEYDRKGVYPAAEAGGTWMQSPKYVPAELQWAGFDIVSHASNHALDYAYGGLEATWDALRSSELPFAGTGKDLAHAASPTYLDAGERRIALLSMSSTFTRWSRAGHAGNGIRGRPGINPLRYHHEIGPDVASDIESLATKLGWWVMKEEGEELTINPPGLHNTVYTFPLSDDHGLSTVVAATDKERHLRAIRDMKNRADIVMVHIHTHAFDPDFGLHVPSEFLPEFARACVDNGADIIISQGSHAPLRGIEIHESKPIFYDPGELFIMSDAVERLPLEFYLQQEGGVDSNPWEMTPSEAFEKRRASIFEPVFPPGGYHSGSVVGNIIPVCQFDGSNEITSIRLHPGSWFEATEGLSGIPKREQGTAAKGILEYVDDLSARFDTSVTYRNDGAVGIVDLE